MMVSPDAAELRTAVFPDIPDIRQLQRQFGEGAVDVRSEEALRSAIEANQMIVVTHGDRVVGVASYFERIHDNDSLTFELGGLTLDPQYRGFGLAQLLASIRLLMILHTYEATPILSEVYASSIASLRYLIRIGFCPLDRVPFDLHQKAFEANQSKAVVYMVADPAFYFRHCERFERVLETGLVRGKSGTLRVEISNETFGMFTHLLRASHKPKFSDKAYASRDGIGYGALIQRWLARSLAQPSIKRSEFLSAIGKGAASWGYPASQVDRLAEDFIRSVTSSKTAGLQS